MGQSEVGHSGTTKNLKSSPVVVLVADKDPWSLVS